jgi:hypothetical protein
MKFVAYALAATGLAAIPAAANAADWWLAVTNGAAFSFVDVSTIQKPTDATRIAWGELHNFEGTYEAVRVRYDCTDKSMTILNSVSYDENGRVIRTNDTPSKTTFAGPDSLGWFNVSFVCEFAGSNTPENPDRGTQQLKPGMRPSQWLANLRADAAEAVQSLRRKN